MKTSTMLLAALTLATAFHEATAQVEVLPPLRKPNAAAQKAPASSEPTIVPGQPIYLKKPVSDSTAWESLDDQNSILHRIDNSLQPVDQLCSGLHPCDSGMILPRFSLRHDWGRGVGFNTGFTYAEAFVPLYQESDAGVIFADARLVNFDDVDRWEFNVGGGVRGYCPLIGGVLGANAFYDGRQTENNNYFQQVGIGAEVLWKRLEMRFNGYMILGPDHLEVFDTGPVRSVQGNNIVFTRDRIFERALGGAEIEVGGLLPVPPLESIYPRGYIGFYSYSTNGVEAATGVRGRLEAQVGRHISLHFAVQNDARFNTTLTAGVAIHFGAPAFRAGRGEPTWSEVLGQRVHRDVNVVLTQETGSTQTSEEIPPPPQEEGPR